MTEKERTMSKLSMLLTAGLSNVGNQTKEPYALVATLKKRRVWQKMRGSADILRDLIDNKGVHTVRRCNETSLQERMRYYKKKFNPVEGRKSIKYIHLSTKQS